MENNHRSAQSILLSNNSIGSGTANANNSSPPSHSLSRRASFTSCEVQSLNNDDYSKYLGFKSQLHLNLILKFL